MTPKYGPPRHLAPLVAQLERIARGERVRIVCHAPPRHGKSETVLHAIAWLIWQKPELAIGYASYGLRLPRRVARRARNMVQQLGVPLALKRADEWRTAKDGGVLTASVGASIMGFGLDVLIVDDPYAGRRDAESANQREAVQEWFNEDAFSRLQPEGSCIVFATRWHTKDLSGVLIADGWEYLRLPAVSDEGQPLWPEVWNLEALEQKKRRVGAYGWASVFQGQPVPRGGNLFTATPPVWTKLPEVYRASFGVDLAYSRKTSRDYSVVVKVLRDGQGRYFITDVRRRQVKAPKFKKLCRLLHRKEPAAPWRWYTSTTESGTAELFQEGPRGVPLEPVLASADKFTRAQAFAAAWNEGLVHVPKDAPWLDDFLSELFEFTGADGETDDQVDAVVAAFDLLDDGDAFDADDVAPKRVKRTGVAALDM